jgi:hypothetical protein
MYLEGTNLTVPEKETKKKEENCKSKSGERKKAED